MPHKQYGGQMAMLRREDKRKAEAELRAIRAQRPSKVVDEYGQEVKMPLDPETKEALRYAFWITLATLICIIVVALAVKALV